MFGATGARRLAIPLVTSLSLFVLAACSGGSQPAPVATTLVSRADVGSGVTATGSLSAITTQDLGFAKGGQLTSVKVKVGDRVTAGQTLATIDTADLTAGLAQAQANVDQQKASLARLQANPSLAGANSGLSQAKVVLSATQHEVSATDEADRATIHRAKKQLAADRDAQDQAESARDAVKKACDASRGNTASASSIKTLQDRYLQLLQAGDTAGADAALAALTLAVQAAASSAGSSPCTGVVTADAAVTAAKERLVGSVTAVSAAEQRRKVDQAAGRLTVENTRSAVVAAQSAANATGSDRPYAIDQQTALVQSAESLLDVAQQDLDDATLKAPFAGTVSAINGRVGEFLSPSTGTTALAPGSGAAIPGTDSSGSAAAGAASVTRPGGSQFLVLSDVDQLQVVLPFEQSDAAEIKAKQQVTVGFDAVPGLTEPGTVTSVAPTSTAIAGVISYYVTVRLDATDPRLKSGQTARATVLTQGHRNVLSVPNDAVRQQAGQSAVVVVDAAGNQQTVVFTPGNVGADRTEVLSGLTEGQRVLSQKGQ